MNPETFSDRFKLVLGNASVNSFAQKCGVSESLLRKYLSGSCPGLDKAASIAEAAGVDLTWLATGHGMMRPAAVSATTESSPLQPGMEPTPNIFWDEDAEEVQIQPLLNMTAEVLTSDTVYRPALAANIKAFHRSISLEKDHLKMKQRMDSMESKLTALERRLSGVNGRGKATAIGE